MTTTPRSREELIRAFDTTLGVGGAEDILHILDELGLAIVPKEPTEEMEGAAIKAYRESINAAETIGAAIAASPFAKGKTDRIEDMYSAVRVEEAMDQLIKALKE